jgi:ComF family protein
MIAQSVREVFPDEQFDFVTCVPMHKKSFKERGYNQAELLAKECAKFLSLPYVDTLEKFKENKTQHSVSGKERAQNVRGVYRIIEKDRVAGKKILIIDDIITTGNTLGECARIISKAKCTKICCATLCAVTHN